MNYTAVIFDLDETVLDTRPLRVFRDSRDWLSCKKNADMSTPFPDMVPLLLCLSSRNIPIGFVTNAPRSYAFHLLNHHRIPFDTLIGYHDCARRKPYPEPMLKCASMLGHESCDAIISVGDDSNDIRASKRANMVAIGVTWGVSDEIQLKEAGADLVFHNTQEISKFLLENLPKLG